MSIPDPMAAFALAMARPALRAKLSELAQQLEVEAVKLGLVMGSLIKPYAIRWLEKEMQVTATPHSGGGWHLQKHTAGWDLSLYNSPVGKRYDGVMGVDPGVSCELDNQCCGDESFEVFIRAEGDIRGYVPFADVKEIVEAMKAGTFKPNDPENYEEEVNYEEEEAEQKEQEKEEPKDTKATDLIVPMAVTAEEATKAAEAIAEPPNKKRKQNE